MKKTLKKLGISSNAITIYLELLQKGASSVENLSKATGMSRTSIYPYIEELKENSLIEWNENLVDKAIEVRNPDTLRKIADVKLKKAQSIVNEVDSILPDIRAMLNVSDSKYFVQKFTGVQSCREALSQTYSQKKMTGYCGEFVYDELGKKWYEEHLYNLYKVHKIHDRVLFTKEALKEKSYKDLKKSKWYDEKYAFYRVHPVLKLPKAMDVYIMDSKVLYFFNEGDEPICIIVKSQKHRDYENDLFEVLWQSAIHIKDVN